MTECLKQLTLPSSFQHDLEERIDKMSYIEAILDLCELYSMEPEVMGGLLTRQVVSCVKSEAIDKNWLPKEDKLPFLDDA